MSATKRSVWPESSGELRPRQPVLPPSYALDHRGKLLPAGERPAQLHAVSDAPGPGRAGRSTSPTDRTRPAPRGRARTASECFSRRRGGGPFARIASRGRRARGGQHKNSGARRARKRRRRHSIPRPGSRRRRTLFTSGPLTRDEAPRLVLCCLAPSQAGRTLRRNRAGAAARALGPIRRGFADFRLSAPRQARFC